MDMSRKIMKKKEEVTRILKNLELMMMRIRRLEGNTMMMVIATD